MALINSTDDIRKFVSVDVSFDYNNLLPDIHRCLHEYLIPYLSQEQYDSIDNAYQNGQAAPGPTTMTLIEYAQSILVLFAFHNYLPLAQVNISDIGVHLDHSGSNKTAWQWQINQLSEDYFKRLGYITIEQMLIYLEDNADTFTLWAQSDSSTINKSFLINDRLTFQKFYPIQRSPLTFLSLLPFIHKSQAFYLAPHITQELIDDLTTKLANNSLSVHETKLVQMLRPAIAQFSIGFALKSLPIHFNEYSASVLTKDSNSQNHLTSNTPDPLTLKRADSCINDGRSFLQLALKYLQLHASESVFSIYYDYQNSLTPFTNSESTDRKFFSF